MAFCENCGSPLEENLKFCPNCGTRVEAPAAAAAAPVFEPIQEPAPVAPEVPVEEPAPVAPEAPAVEPAPAAPEAVEGKGMAVLSYFGILVLIPLFAAKDKPFARFHTNQGLILLIAEILWRIVDGIIGKILGGVFLLGGLWGVINALVGIAIFVLAILGIINAAKGRAKELPFIGAFRILK